MKRASLLLGWCAILFLQYVREKTWPGRFAQRVLLINVLEAGISGCRTLDLAAGIPLILLSFFSPEFYVDDENNLQFRMAGSVAFVNLCNDKIRNPLSPRNYLRCYHILLIALYAVSEQFNTPGQSYSVFAILSCALPLLYSELVNTDDSYLARIFMWRVYALIWGTWIDTLVDPEYMEITSYQQYPQSISTSPLLRNGISLLVMAGCSTVLMLIVARRYCVVEMDQ